MIRLMLSDSEYRTEQEVAGSDHGTILAHNLWGGAGKNNNLSQNSCYTG
jgi:hypothetical protein